MGIVPEEIDSCHRMVFVGRDKLLLATAKLTLQLVDLSSSENEMKVMHTFGQEHKFDIEGIHLMDASAYGRYAVVGDHQAHHVRPATSRRHHSARRQRHLYHQQEQRFC